ncbi:hypothetical protein ASC95_19980 [Pelomonas sp. Root1217]|nr:hypothetical protein ASC95_19980 [Pelomonas sp. Root1217]
MAIHHHLATAILAAGLSAAASHATAATASVSLNNIRFELVDLDLNDGVTPQVHFLAGYSAVYSRTSSGTGPNPDAQEVYGSLGQALGPVSSITGLSASSGHVFVGDLFGAGVNISSNAQAWGEGNSANVWTYGFAISFLLTPQTQLLLRADTSASFTSKPGESTTMQSSISLQSLDLGQVSFARQLTTFDAFGVYVDGPNQFFVSYSNPASQYLQGSAFAAAYASAQGVASAVPEPASAGLLLAGLASLSALTRRRR